MRRAPTQSRPSTWISLALALATLPVNAFGGDPPPSPGPPSGGPEASSLRVVFPRVERIQDPLGVEAAHPRLSWVLEARDPAARGLEQTGRRILVASSRERLDCDEGDVWDSGRVESGETHLVPYAGRPLESWREYRWKVQVWDEKGRASAWSPTGSWTQGLRTPSDWKGRWIEAPSGGDPALPIFRRTFTPSRKVRRALAAVSGLGFFELYLNGRKVGDAALEPGWTDYRKTCFYALRDVTDLLVSGENALGILLGRGFFNVPGGRYVKYTGSFGRPKFRLQLRIEYADGSVDEVVSDDSWRTTPGPVRFSCIYGGEDGDARAEPKDWDRPGFDDGAWARALPVEGPGGALRWSPASEIRVIEVLPTRSIARPRAGIAVHDLGQNHSGRPRITVEGPAGSTVKLIPGELLDANGLVTQASSGGPVSFSYTLRGGGPESWSPRFSYYGYRYVQVEGAEDPASGADSSKAPRILALSSEFLHAGARRVGEFEADDETLDRIHRLILAAIRSNLQSVLTDCPHREKLGWLEVSQLLAGGILYNFDAANIYAKISDDMRESQTPEGLVPDIAPEYTVFSGGFRDSPEWGSAVAINPWTIREFDGDESLLREHFDVAARYSRYLASKSKDGILSHGLGDWCDVGPGGPGESQLTSRGLTATAVWYQDLEILRDAAGILGRVGEAEAFAAQADSVRAAFQAAFFRPETKTYDRESQTALAMPLVLGLVPPDARAAVLANLVRIIRAGGNRVTAGDVGFVYLVRALSDGGRGDVLLEMVLRDDGPGYMDQLRKGATSLVETWDTNPATSQNHCMLGHAEEWFYRGLAGIRTDPAHPGFRRFAIRPEVVGSLRRVRARYDSPRGAIESAWTREGDAVTLECLVPPNTRALIHVPVRGAGRVLEGSLPADAAEGVRFLRRDSDAAVYEVRSGRYRFRAE